MRISWDIGLNWWKRAPTHEIRELEHLNHPLTHHLLVLYFTSSVDTCHLIACTTRTVVCTHRMFACTCHAHACMQYVTACTFPSACTQTEWMHVQLVHAHTLGDCKCAGYLRTWQGPTSVPCACTHDVWLHVTHFPLMHPSIYWCDKCLHAMPLSVHPSTFSAVMHRLPAHADCLMSQAGINLMTLPANHMQGSHTLSYSYQTYCFTISMACLNKSLSQKCHSHDSYLSRCGAMAKP